jgi:hypothetical protein
MSYEPNGFDYAIKVLCMICQNAKKENKILSGFLKFTTNFRLHIKVMYHFIEYRYIYVCVSVNV